MILCRTSKGVYLFYCPGCKRHHVYYTNECEKCNVHWNFNGDWSKPTFSPSLLNRWGKYVDPNYEGEYSGICHLFMVNGQLQFCADCTHELAGKIVDMLTLDKYYEELYKDINP